MCPDFFPRCGHCCSHNASNLTCVYNTPPSKTWSTSVGLFHRPLLTAATHHKHVLQSVNMSSQFPAGLQCDPVQMVQVVQQEYVLVDGACLYLRVNIENTVHLWKHHSYCLQSQTRGHNTGLPSAIWSPMTMTNELLTLQPVIIHVYWTQSLRMLHFFR